MPLDLFRDPASARLRDALARDNGLTAALWQECLEALEASGTKDENLLVRLAELARNTRELARLQGLYLSETCALSLDLLLTLRLCARIAARPSQRAVVLEAGRRLADGLRAYGPGALRDEAARARRRELFETVSLLAGELDGSPADSNGGLYAAFPVLHGNESGEEALRLRSADVHRIEEEALQVYVLDYPLETILERASGIGGLLSLLTRNGYVCDSVALLREGGEECHGGLLRMVFASQLGKDFVEALLRIPEYRVHAVDMDAVRAGAPSWEVEEAPECQLRPPSQAALDSLVEAYAASMDAMFREGRQEQPLHPATTEESEDPLLAAFEEALAKQRAEGDAPGCVTPPKPR